MSHTCPAPGCNALVPSGMLACRADWYRLPRGLRNRIWGAWAGGTGAGSKEHTDAVLEAEQWYREHA